MSTLAVKAARTVTSPEKSQAEIQRILRRYGATGYQFSHDHEQATASVSFRVPDAPKSTQMVPVYLPVSVLTVANRLYGTRRDRASQFYGKQWEQAERVAWRHLVLWIDAALTAATMGLQTITEAFFAHAVVGALNGRPERMIEYVEREQSLLANGVRALLTAPADMEIEA